VIFYVTNTKLKFDLLHSPKSIVNILIELTVYWVDCTTGALCFESIQ